LNKTLLFITVLVIATCGLIYELIVGALASYLLGDSITQFSTVIGGYLFAMGIGSYLSRFLDKGLAQRFVEVELGVALVGGLCAPVLFLTFALTNVFQVVLYGSVIAIGTLVGLEIPLLLRILKDQVKFQDLVSQVLTLFTTPVVYLYFDRLALRVRRRAAARFGSAEAAAATGPEGTD